ncbi:hypothetical protein [Nonomuraea typhae]|uniref:hypothetical protein n=1 Tax=Nonomuraea typhae TaxID=2603600 RepID=UPI0012F9FF41|nr:hypothetical protein [Nonomuraea typhae]
MDDLKILAELRADAPLPDADRLRGLRRRATRRRRWPVIVPSLLVTAVAAVTVVIVASTSRAPEVRPLPAVETVLLNSETVLERAARTVEKRAAAPEPRPGQWQYTKTLNVQPADGRTTTQEGAVFADVFLAAGIVDRPGDVP